MWIDEIKKDYQGIDFKLNSKRREYFWYIWQQQSTVVDMGVNRKRMEKIREMFIDK